MPKTTTSTRQRGVKASPYKLTRARKAAGLASQAAVAQKIADIEGLDNPPKDVVNRAFRGVKVSPDTIDRLAVALGVAPHSLLMTSDEAADAAPSADAEASPPSPVRQSAARRWIARGVGAGLALLVFAGVWTGRAPVPPAAPTQKASRPAIEAFAPLANSGASVRVVAVSQRIEPALLQAVREALAADFAMPTLAADELQSGADAARGIATIATTARLILDAQVAGRWVGLNAALEAFDERHHVWAYALPRSRIAERAPVLARELRTAVSIAIGAAEAPPGFFVRPVPAQLDYIAGMDLLDGPSLELNIHRAQSRFEAALRRSPNDARAVAGLCLAQLEKYWMLDEARSIEDARLTCAQAERLAGDDARVAHALARLLHVSGSNAAAIARLEALVARDPNDADAWNYLAWNRWNQFHATADAAQLDRAQEAASRAAQADGDIWKPYFQLALIASMRNDIEQAIAESKRALARNENSFLLANLGTFQTCVGQFGQAQATLERAQALSAGAYIGDEMMSKLHYFQGDFDQALALIQRAINSFEGGEPATHPTWSALADAYRQVGQFDEALEAYRLAINIVETDLLNADVPLSARAARLYYYARVAQLSPQALSPTTQAALRDELTDVAALQTEPVGYRFIALAYALNGQPDEAREFVRKATARCGGYRHYPDFMQVLGAL